MWALVFLLLSIGPHRRVLVCWFILRMCLWTDILTCDGEQRAGGSFLESLVLFSVIRTSFLLYDASNFSYVLPRSFVWHCSAAISVLIPFCCLMTTPWAKESIALPSCQNFTVKIFSFPPFNISTWLFCVSTELYIYLLTFLSMSYRILRN